jgi:hypothetical protein
MLFFRDTMFDRNSAKCCSEFWLFILLSLMDREHRVLQLLISLHLQLYVLITKIDCIRHRSYVSLPLLL